MWSRRAPLRDEAIDRRRRASSASDVCASPFFEPKSRSRGRTGGRRELLLLLMLLPHGDMSVLMRVLTNETAARVRIRACGLRS